MRNLLPFLFLLIFEGISAQNQAPVIQNLNVQVNLSTQSIKVTYAVSDAENDLLDVSLQFSSNGGKTYSLAPINALGDLGYPVSPGTGKSITCNLNTLSGTGNFKARLIVDDKNPVDLALLVKEVDSLRLRENLRFVEGVRHRTGGAVHLAETRDSIRNLFDALELYREDHNFTTNNIPGVNILGQFSGVSSAEKTVIIDAHYDTVNGAPGADDNGSGTVGVWEIARILSRYPSKKTLRYIGFDLEESGLYGSKKYVSTQIPAPEVIEGVFNFEMIGYYSNEPNSQTTPSGFNVLFPGVYSELEANSFRGDFITNVGNGNSQALNLLFSTSAQQFVPGLKVVNLVVPGNGSIAPDLNRSDHSPFWTANKPALMLTDGAEFRNECYHTSSDTAENKLNFTFMSQVVQTTLAAAAQLAELIHGDWVNADFQVPVSAPEAQGPCGFQMLSRAGAIRINTGDCGLQHAQFRVFDEKGALILNTVVELSAQSMQELPFSAPSGTYFYQLEEAGKSWGGKLQSF